MKKGESEGSSQKCDNEGLLNIYKGQCQIHAKILPRGYLLWKRVTLGMIAVKIFFTDGSQGCGCREHTCDIVILNDTEECSRIRRTNGFALKNRDKYDYRNWHSRLLNDGRGIYSINHPQWKFVFNSYILFLTYWSLKLSQLAPDVNLKQTGVTYAYSNNIFGYFSRFVSELLLQNWAASQYEYTPWLVYCYPHIPWR